MRPKTQESTAGVMFEGVERALMTAVKILSKVSPDQIARQVDRVKIDQALQSLRQIFFFPGELIHSLELISSGEAIEPEVARFFRDQFENVSSDVVDAIRYLQADLFEQSQSLSLKDIEIIESIRYGKLDLRRSVHRYFAFYLAALESGDSRRLEEATIEAARLLGQVERLNSSIKKLESALKRARKKP